MSRRDVRVKGLGVLGRFVLSMSIALLVVMLAGGGVLYMSATTVAERIQQDALYQGLKLSAQNPLYEQEGNQMHTSEAVPGGASVEVRYGEGLDRTGRLFEWKDEEDPDVSHRLFLPGNLAKVGEELLGLIVAFIAAVVLVGAIVAAWVASRVTRPMIDIVGDVRQIARGDLGHRTRVKSGGEVEVLARAIDRMAGDLEDAQEAEIELQVREREMEVAGEVREALLPTATPMIPNYDLGSAHVATSNSGGDFHEFIEREDGQLGLLVCDVSGQGVPAALIGATARAYLRTELSEAEDVAAGFAHVNRLLRDDVRRGMYVTALYALFDPKTGTMKVACAGHKVPLVRYCAADKKLRLVHPDGIALGFDKGPVFEKRLEFAEVSLDVGDRILLATTGPLSATDAKGEELGEKRFFRIALKYATQPTPKFLRGIRQELMNFAGEEELPVDVSMITMSRES